RTLLTTLGVAIGVIAIVAISAVARGLRNSVDSGIHLFGSHLLIYERGTAMDFLSTLDEEETRAALMADPDVVDTAAGQSHLQTRDGILGSILIVIGVEPDAYTVREQNTIRGRFMRADDEVNIGTALSRSIGKDVGDTITMYHRSFKIVGVYQLGNVFFDWSVTMKLKTLQGLMGREGKVTCFYVRLRDGADPEAVADRLERNHPRIAAIANAGQYDKVDQGLKYTDSFVWVISFLALIIGTLVVANTMWMSVNQRTREIGILRAVGWSRRDVMTIILVEAAGIGLIACAVGCALGVGLAYLATLLPVAQQFVDPVFGGGPFLTAGIVSISVSVLGALLPAFRAAQISPVEALRYE
ncbi:MAG: ABC transporter permease, partial [Phycisphaerae bacterium]